MESERFEVERVQVQSSRTDASVAPNANLLSPSPRWLFRDLLDSERVSAVVSS